MGYILKSYFDRKAVAAIDDYNFSVNGVAYPRDFLVRAGINGGAFLVPNFDKGADIEIPANSTVAGSVPEDQAALIAALAAIVTPEPPAAA